MKEDLFFHKNGDAKPIFVATLVVAFYLVSGFVAGGMGFLVGSFESESCGEYKVAHFVIPAKPFYCLLDTDIGFKGE